MRSVSACAHVTPVTVWVVSKNESNCLLENKLMFILIWRRQITVVCLIKHFTFHRFLSKILNLRERVAFYTSRKFAFFTKQG